MHELNPVFMKDIFHLRKQNYATRNEQICHPNPRTVTYGLESFGYKATQIWRSIPYDIRNNPNINAFKNTLLKIVVNYVIVNYADHISPI